MNIKHTPKHVRPTQEFINEATVCHVFSRIPLCLLIQAIRKWILDTQVSSRKAFRPAVPPAPPICPSDVDILLQEGEIIASALLIYVYHACMQFNTLITHREKAGANKKSCCNDFCLLKGLHFGNCRTGLTITQQHSLNFYNMLVDFCWTCYTPISNSGVGFQR